MTYQQPFVDISLSDLIDKLSILKIKEWMLSNNYDEMIRNVDYDVDEIIKEKDIKCSAELIRKISIITICNLMVWFLKDKMKETSNYEQYIFYLKEAQDLNNCIKNSMKNMIMEEISSLNISNKKTTFLEHRQGQWFFPIVENNDKKS